MLHDESVPLELLPGAEISFELLPELDDTTLRRFGLGGSARYVLVETPYYGWPLGLADTFFHLRARGFTLVLAHPERNPEVQENPALLAPLVETGTFVQVTAASLDGRLGTAARKASRRLLQLGLVHLIASDAHAPEIRGVGMASAVEAIGDRALGRWLTQEVPAAILGDGELPPRPETSGLRSRLSRLGR